MRKGREKDVLTAGSGFGGASPDGGHHESLGTSPSSAIYGDQCRSRRVRYFLLGWVWIVRPFSSSLHKANHLDINTTCNDSLAHGWEYAD